MPNGKLLMARIRIVCGGSIKGGKWEEVADFSKWESTNNAHRRSVETAAALPWWRFWIRNELERFKSPGFAKAALEYDFRSGL